MSIEAMNPVAWIKVRDLTYMQVVVEQGATEWNTNLGLKPEPDDEGLYTETQVQELKESFEQSVTDPENQPSQYGTVLMKKWVGLTEDEVALIAADCSLVTPSDFYFAQAIEAKLKEKNV